MTGLRENKTACETIAILDTWKERPHHRLGGICPDRAWITFEEERREVLGAVLESVAGGSPDPVRTAASLDLLRHGASPGFPQSRVRIS